MNADLLQRRLANAEFTLTAFRRRAELVNNLLDMIDRGTIDEYCREWSEKIKENERLVTRLKLEIMYHGHTK